MPLQEIFASKARIKVLQLLLSNPHERYYQSQIADILGLVIGSVQQEMPRLEKAGIVTREEDGNRVYYRANRNCPIFPELKAIFLKATGVGESLGNYLKKHPGEVRAAFIYGSYAKGEEESWSDIDLLVVGGISSLSLANLVTDAEKTLGREVNYRLYAPEEYRRKVRAKDHFLAQVLREKKIFVVGNEDELGKLVKT
jgi:predicted nucleotidyltransferase